MAAVPASGLSPSVSSARGLSVRSRSTSALGARLGKAGLGQDQPVGHRHLAHRLGKGVERRQAVHHVDHGDDAVEIEMLGDRRMAHH